MENWDALGMSWLQNDLLGCIIPSEEGMTISFTYDIQRHSFKMSKNEE